MIHFLYAVTAEATPLVKIGHARGPLSRLAAHQIGSPLRLSIARLWRFTRREYAIRVETACHRLFATAKAHGEWHDVGLDDIDAAVADYCAERGVAYSVGDMVAAPCKPVYPPPRHLSSKWQRAHELAQAVLLEDAQ